MMIVNTNPKGDLTNALIHFDPIKGPAVGLFIRYPMLRRSVNRFEPLGENLQVVTCEFQFS